VLVKSVVLALAVSKVVAQRGKHQMLLIIAVLIGVQLVGALAEWALLSSVSTLLLCFPGVALQIVAAYWIAEHSK
jgi:hypothetical protein